MTYGYAMVLCNNQVARGVGPTNEEVEMNAGPRPRRITSCMSQIMPMKLKYTAED